MGLRATWTLCLFLLAASTAMAQSGGVRITVADESGEPLPGAVVTISHETGSIKTTSEMTDKWGIIEFPVLRPGGGYSIRIAFPGYSLMRYDDIRVKLGRTTVVRVEMIGELEESVRVSAKSEVIELDKTESSTRFSDDFIADLPVFGRFYQNILTMAPGVQDADGDGNPNVHGSRSRDFQAVVSGVSNVDPLTGQWFSRINTNSIEEMEVITAGAGVEFGRAQGGFARIIQKQGSNSHEGIVEVYWRTSKLDGDGAENSSDLAPPDFDTLQPGFQFSGPVIRDRLWYRASFERIDDEQPVNVSTGIEVFRRTRETQDAQLTWQLSPRNKLALQFRADPDEASNFGISSRVRPESSRAFDRDVETWTLNWTAPYSPRVLVENTFAWQDINNASGPTVRDLRNDCVPNADQEFIFAAYCVDSTHNTVSGSWYRDDDDHRQRVTLKSQATVYGGHFWGMTHQFKLGLNIENERYFRKLTERPFINFQIVRLLGDDDGGVQSEDEGEVDLDAYGRVLSRLSIPQTDDVRATGTNWAVYAEDQFKPAQNLTLTLGARVDREEIQSGGRQAFDPTAELEAFTAFVDTGATPQAKDDFKNLWSGFFTGYEDMSGFTGQLAEILCSGKSLGAIGACENQVGSAVLSQLSDDLEAKRKASNIEIRNTNVSPFFAAAWSPWADGKTAFKLSLGRHYNNIALIVPLQELEPVRTVVEYRASLVAPENCPAPDPDDPDPPLVACGKTQLVGGIDPLASIVAVDRGIKTPYQDEFSFKVERELWTETSLSVTYINRRFRDQIQDININLGSGDLGRCQRQKSKDVRPVVSSPGRTAGVCVLSHVRCFLDSDCPTGDACGYEYYLTDPVDFCAITGDCLGNEFSLYGTGCTPGVDPYCGLPFPDTVDGAGDGFIDPRTGSADDNCVGENFLSISGNPSEACQGELFCDGVDILRRPDEVTDLYLQSPFWGDIFVIGNHNTIDYEALVVELVRRQYRSWEMNASYTYSEAKGDGEDFFQELGDDPTLRDNIFGYQSYDQRHVVKLNGTTITPWGIRLGTAVTWQSGLPYSLLLEEFSFDTQPPITTEFGGEGIRPRQIYVNREGTRDGAVRNSERNTAYWNVDLKATKELRVGQGMNVQLSAEIFNLLDDGTYQIYNPFFQRGVQINGRNEAQRRFGRRWQVGMKLAF